ncbi:MAG: ABC transporter ATP-binding protein [Rhodospirillaceae bacterium]|jgi:branched-chain amino acid transport system ATP-binding protein|uniref:ABC transporter ATP-binding protein n=1 Tax=unclassified Hwanghaeella TaxID=2605944 RepID=UPI000C48ABB0|nr:ABC transporter ATP-binding protein [Rhodospirillales bacterium]MAX47697.1 ABC transporter ATP-binding protein [Rhodospirillaceae bacterium]|tara:strand:- start:125 stop:883 length:759 start_codon:yes stop_codon:yes gene_type:complete
MTEILRLENVGKQFGGIHAVNDVSFSLVEGEIIGLIGPNGAGKTTLVNLITGVHPLSSGKVIFAGEDVSRQQAFQAARRGLARTFQIVQPFPKMTVLENVAAGALFGGGSTSVQEAMELARKELEFVGLDHVADTAASSLALPNRKRLELAKSLAMRPKVLLLDEVNAGLNATEIDGALDLIRKIAARGVTILIIEHLMKVVLSISQRILVLHHGELIAQGDPRTVIEDPQVVEAYLGSKFAARVKAESHHA